MLEKIKANFSFQSLFWLVFILSIDALIFYFSSQPGAKSASQSGFVLNYFQIVDSLTTQKIIRKLAHFSIYACMGLCWTNFLRTLNLSLRHCFWISILMCFLFAAGDEWHQTFVPGRSGELFDVCLDTFGAILATSCTLWLHTHFFKTNNAQ